MAYMHLVAQPDKGFVLHARRVSVSERAIACMIVLLDPGGPFGHGYPRWTGRDVSRTLLIQARTGGNS